MTALPTQVELCQRPRELGRPCLGQLYRPQPDVVYCYQCGGKEPGVVYAATAQRRPGDDRLLADALMVLRLLERWATLQETWSEDQDAAAHFGQAGEALLAGLIAFRTHHPTALTGQGDAQRAE